MVFCPCLLLNLVAGETRAAFEGIVAGARSTGMGDCLTVSNCGALCLAPLPSPRDRGAISFSYCAPFGLRELAQKSITCTAAFERSAVTIGFVERGASLYRERVLSASVSGGPVASARVSLCLGVYSMCLSRAQTRRLFGLSAGVRIRPVRLIEACVGVDNVAKSRDDGALPQSFLAGLVVMPASRVTVAAEVRKSPQRFSSLHFGAEFQPEAGVHLRCGIQTEPVQLSAGLALELGPLCLETATSFHAVLGRTDVLTLTWQRKEQDR
jgi:hypothetical protein